MKNVLFPSTRSKIAIAPARSTAPPAMYAPVDCDFTDDLEFASVYKICLEITYWASSESLATTEARIRDIVTEPNKEEFVLLDNGKRLRLDQLQALRILD